MRTSSISRGAVILLAVGCGTTGASIYYTQPLLDAIASTLQISDGAAGVLVMASQLGYAASLVLVVPLGDLFERRRMVVAMLLVAASAMALAAIAPSFAVLAAALTFVGVAGSTNQVLMTIAGSLAGEHERGRILATVFGGLLIGILLARTVGGAIADLGGWRLTYWMAAGAMLLLAIAMRSMLPPSLPERGLRYGALLASVGTLIREEPVLRRRMTYVALALSGYSTIWTALTFLLSDPPYEYGEGTIGLFALVGVAGLASSQVAGRFIDRGGGHLITGLGLSLVPVGWVALIFGQHSLAAVLTGIILIDLGIQGQHVANLNAIYPLRPDATSRMMTALMTGAYLSSAIAAAVAAAVYSAGGWGAVVAMGMTLSGLAVVVWIQESFARRRTAAPTPELS